MRPFEEQLSAGRLRCFRTALGLALCATSMAEIRNVVRYAHAWPHQVAHFAPLDLLPQFGPGFALLLVCLRFFLAVRTVIDADPGRVHWWALFGVEAVLVLREIERSQNHVYLLLVVLFWLAVFPPNVRRAQTTVRTPFRRLLAIQIGLVMLFAGLAKLNPAFLSGDAVVAYRWTESGALAWLADRSSTATAAAAAAWGTAVLELVAGQLFLLRRGWRFGWVAGAVLAAGILLSEPSRQVAVFNLQMLALYVLFLPEPFFRAFERDHRGGWGFRVPELSNRIAFVVLGGAAAAASYATMAYYYPRFEGEPAIAVAACGALGSAAVFWGRARPALSVGLGLALSLLFMGSLTPQGRLDAFELWALEVHEWTPGGMSAVAEAWDDPEVTTTDEAKLLVAADTARRLLNRGLTLEARAVLLRTVRRGADSGAGTQISAGDRLRFVELLSAAGANAAAVRWALEVVDERPRSVRAWQLTAVAFSQGGQVRAAARAFARALELGAYAPSIVADYERFLNRHGPDVGISTVAQRLETARSRRRLVAISRLGGSRSKTMRTPSSVSHWPSIRTHSSRSSQ